MRALAIATAKKRLKELGFTFSSLAKEAGHERRYIINKVLTCSPFSARHHKTFCLCIPPSDASYIIALLNSGLDERECFITNIIRRYRPKLKIKHSLNRARFYKYMNKIRDNKDNPELLERYCEKWYKLNEASLIKGLGEEIALKIKKDIHTHITKLRRKHAIQREQNLV